MPEPPPSSTLQVLVLVFTAVPFNQFSTVRKMQFLRKMHFFFFGLCVTLGILCIVRSFQSAALTDVMIGQSRRRFIPRGPTANPGIVHSSSSSSWNYQHLVDSIYNKPACRTSFLHILITSATHHFTQRDIIRNTWCSKTHLIKSFLPRNSSSHIQCTFLIGQSKDVKTMQSIKQEIEKYDDILMGDYTDTYRNLTLKVISGLLWATTDCVSKYILKTDDDCFVNSNILLKVLFSQPEERYTKPMYLGMAMDSLKHTLVIRDPESKWAVSFEEYPPEYYPAYISGTGYLLSQSSATKICKLSKQFVPFPVEDAYIGVLAEYAGVSPQHSYRFTLINENWRMCNFLYLILIHHISNSVQWEFQKLVKTAYKTCDHQSLTMKW